MRLYGFVAALSIFVIAQPGLMHGQQCTDGDVVIVMPCQGEGECPRMTHEVLEAEPQGNRFQKVFTLASCGVDSGGNQCEVVTSTAGGSCLSAALNHPNILRNLDRLSRTSPIPILVASCAGGLIEFHPMESSAIRAPQPVNVDRRILKESISLKLQKHSGE